MHGYFSFTRILKPLNILQENPLLIKCQIMKSFFLVLLLSIFTFSARAQSKNSLIFVNAVAKDKKMQRTGTVLTIVGGATLFTGNILYWKAYNDSRTEPPQNKTDTYRYIMYGGLGLMTVGIPIWAIGLGKEQHIRLEANIIKFKGTASINGVGLKLRF